MLAQVLRSPGGADPLIWLSADRGELVGLWRGDHSPVIGDFIDVELDVREAHSFEELAISRATEDHFEISPETSVMIAGHVLEIDHHDVMTLAVGGALLSIEMEGDAPVGIVGSTISLVIGDLEIHPTGV